MNVSKSLTNVSVAIIGLMSMAVIAVWQFYHFVTFEGSPGLVDVQGGTHHLWWSIGATLLACLAGFFVFSFFVRYDKANEMHITS
jgi:uncharacterized membrane protein